MDEIYVNVTINAQPALDEKRAVFEELKKGLALPKYIKLHRREGSISPFFENALTLESREGPWIRIYFPWVSHMDQHNEEIGELYVQLRFTELALGKIALAKDIEQLKRVTAEIVGKVLGTRLHETAGQITITSRVPFPVDYPKVNGFTKRLLGRFGLGENEIIIANHTSLPSLHFSAWKRNETERLYFEVYNHGEFGATIRVRFDRDFLKARGAENKTAKELAKELEGLASQCLYRIKTVARLDDKEPKGIPSPGANQTRLKGARVHT